MPRARAVVLSTVAVVAAGFASLLATGAGAATPCTITWGGGNGVWSAAAAWAEARVPVAADVVCLEAGEYTVTVADSPTVAELRVGSGVLLAVRAPYNTTSTLTVGNATNAGTVSLDSGDRYSSAGLVVAEGGTLHNTGTLRTQHGPADCCVNSRSITGAVANAGTVSIGWGTTFTGALTNTGTLSVDQGHTLTVAGASSTLTLADGTVAAAGALNVDGGTVTVTGGTVTGNPPNVAGGDVVFSPGSTGTGEVRAHGTTELRGTVPAGATVRLRTGYNEASNLAIPADVTNNGTVVVDTGDRYGSTAFTVAPGATLTNAGALRFENGPADCCHGSRTATGTIVNTGTVTVGISTTYDGAFTNSGTVETNAPFTVTGSGSSLTHAGGTLTGTGQLTVNNGTFTWSGGTIAGDVPPWVGNGTVAFPGTATRAGEVRVHGATAVQGDVPAGVTLRQRSWYNEASVLTFAGSVTNAGTVVVESADRYASNRLVVPAGGTLTNTGTLRSAQGPADCCTGDQVISGAIDNSGTFAIERSTRVETPVRNTGTTTIAPGATMTLAGGLASFEQVSGSLTNGGGLVQDAGTFRYAGGSVSGNEIVLIGNRLELPASAGERSGTFRVRGGSPTISGDVPAGVTVDVRPAYSESTTLTADASFTNAGTILLNHDERYSGVALVVPGTLTNEGTLRSQLGRTDCCVYGRTFTGGLVNKGLLDVQLDLTLDTQGATYTSSGNVTIAAGRALSANGREQVFEMSGGTLDVAGSLNLSNMTFRYTGGSITGTQLSLTNMDVQFGSAGAAVPFVMRGSSTLTGDVPAGQVLAVRPGYAETATLRTTRATTNAGTIVLDSTGRYATTVLDVTAGGLTNSGTLATRLGATDCCQYDRQVLGDVVNTGTVSVEQPTTYTGTLTNDGTVTVTEAGSLVVTNAASTVRQRAGSFTATGSVDVRGGTVELAHGALGGVVGIENGALSFAVGATAGGAEFRTRGTTALTGDVPAGVTIRARAPYSGAATLAATAPFTNAGTIALDHDGRWGTAALQLGEHLLTNDGTISAALGATDCCAYEQVTGTVVNRGTIRSANDLSLGTVTNSGTLHAAAGQLKVTALTDLAGGVLAGADGVYDVADGAALRIGSALVETNAARIRLAGTGALTTLGGADLLASLRANTRILRLVDGKQLAVAGALANTGVVEVANGSRLAAGSTYTQSGDGSVTEVHDAVDPAEGKQPARLAASGLGVVLNGGTLAGNGRIEGDLGNESGTLEVDRGAAGPLGTLTVTGAFRQGEAGATHLDVQGATPGTYDVLAVGGEATLGGTLHVPAPPAGLTGSDAVTPLTAGSVSGAFEHVTGVTDGWSFTPVYGAGVRLEVTEFNPPANPALTSTTHTAGAWSRTAVATVSATGASDDLSGVAGFSYTWSPVADTVPDETVDAPASFGGTSSPALPDGSHWFHLRTVDAEGNWSDPVHFGPVRVDRTAPAVPTGSSASHPSGVWSNDATVDVALGGGADALSGRDGWSYAWSTSATTEPDATADTAADVSALTSAELPTGLHYLHVRSVDAAGNAGPVAHLGPYRVDVTAPKAAALTSPAAAAPFSIAWSSTSKVPVVKAAWSGASDPNSGIRGYRVAYRSAPAATAAFGSVAYSASTTASGWSLSAKQGTTYCLAVETRDKAGNVAPLSAERCVTTPLDNTALTASKKATGTSHWTRPSSTGAYFGTVSSTTTLNATLKTGTVKTRRVALVVDKCSTCGSVKVYLGSTLLGTYSLAGSGTHVVIPVKSWATTQTGVVTVKVSTSGKPVKVDAVGVGAV